MSCSYVIESFSKTKAPLHLTVIIKNTHTHKQTVNNVKNFTVLKIGNDLILIQSNSVSSLLRLRLSGLNYNTGLGPGQMQYHYLVFEKWS